MAGEVGTKAEVISRLEELILPLLEAQGAELVELQYSRPKRGRGVLRLFVGDQGAVMWPFIQGELDARAGH